MSTTQLKLIAMVVGLLVILWGASEFVSRRPQSSGPALRLPTVSSSDVDTITITHGADTVMLARQSPSQWTVNGFPASRGAVDDLFQAVRDSTSPELAAENPASFSRMGVDSASGRWLRFLSHGRPTHTIIVGSHGPTPDDYYLRLPGNSRVYVAHGRLAHLVEHSVDDWRDHQIAQVPPESVGIIRVTRGKTRVELRRQDGKWPPADSSVVARLLDRTRALNATGFASGRTADSLKKARPVRSVTLETPAGRELMALTIDSTAGLFWVRRPGDSTYYRLDSWDVDQLTPAIAR
jgi:hypothetical protein